MQAVLESSVPPLGPCSVTPQSISWWERQRVLAAQWMREVEAAGEFDHPLASHAASCLLLVVEFRGMPAESTRDPDSWEGIDAYEILFENVGLGGRNRVWEIEDVLRAVGSFAGFLGRHGEIPVADHARLQVDYPLWMDRLVEVIDTGAWYERDGTYLPPLAGH